MKKIIESTDFNYEYKSYNFNEKEIIVQGFKQLTGKKLKEKITNTTIYGDYPGGYKFVTEINKNGTTKGINHVGSRDFGKWTIDFEKNTLHLKWERNWFETITRAYSINESIVFFDIDTGTWRTTFRKITKW